MDTNKIFQGVGILEGKVIRRDNKYFLILRDKEYQLMMCRPNLHKYLKFDEVNRIAVYPKIVHFPQRDVDAILSFQVIGVQTPGSKSKIFNELKPGEFKLSGLWQFIPVSRKPVISIYRNWDSFKQQNFKSDLQKFWQGKPQHVPIIWRDSVVNPYRHNPRQTKEEAMSKYFVQIKAKFDYNRDCFMFMSMLDMPATEGFKPFVMSKDFKSKVEVLRRKQLKTA